MPLCPSVPKKPTSMAFANLVVKDGAVTSRDPEVKRPLEAATGCVASTPA
jgi:hypothetical protein